MENDPKREMVYQKVQAILKAEPHRKIVLFTEYVDTVLHLASFFKEKLGAKVLICDGKIHKSLAKALEKNFNAQYEGGQQNDFQVLITSDKLSEGFNLNRAGAIINYDIPWNPTRVIQRVGRINRIGKKVFDLLYIFNFFPSEVGAGYVKSREIAQQKMFMIHNALGEDAQIFDAKEEPTASGLYAKLNDYLEKDEALNLMTKVRNLFGRIKEEHPEVIERIEKLPNRVKTSKKSKEASVNVLRKKGLSLFAQQATAEESSKVMSLTFEACLDFISCEYDTKRLPLSEDFWPIYEEIKGYKEKIRSNKSDLAIEKKAHDNLKVALKVMDVSEEEDRAFIKTLIKDIRYYYTMSVYTWRRLAFKKLSLSSPKSEWKQFFKELTFIKIRFGVDYLDCILERVKDKKEEVIIAVENRKDSSIG